VAGRVEMTTCNNLNSYASRSSESMNFDYSQKTQEVLDACQCEQSKNPRQWAL
jgi:hypothetical protein